MKTVTVHLLVDSDDDTAIRGLVYYMLTPTMLDPVDDEGVRCVDYHVEEPIPAATYVEQAFRDDEYEEGLFMPTTTD